MTLRRLLTFIAVISFASAIGSLLAPAALWELFGITLEPGGAFIARRYAAAGLGFAVVAWLARNGGAETQRTAAFGFLTFLVGTFIAGLAAQLSGLMSPAGWAIVLIDLLLAGAFAYALFRERATGESAAQIGQQGQLSNIDGGM